MISGGLREKGVIKKSQVGKPLITIITVVYNDAGTLEDTILSVVNQTYENVEYIVVDGASTDGTLEIIKKYNNRIDYWTSEPDDGLYFAMNKGIALATGEWINLMNSGDSFYENTTLSELFGNQVYDSIDMIVGTVFIRSTWGNFWGKIPKPNSIWKQFYHQAIFSKRSLNLEFPFDTSYKASADFNFVYKVYTGSRSIFVTDKIIASIEYSEDSYSISHTVNARKDELRSIMQSDKKYLIRILYHFEKLCRAYISSFLQKNFPALLKYYRKKRDT
jgi:glycosyltransferase involved in cell wall biosynthesis